MPDASPKDVADSFYRAFNGRELERAEEILAPGGRMVYQANGDALNGPAEVQAMWESWIRAFPDARIDVVNVTGEGETVAVEFVGHGTHEGPLELPDGGEAAPTGRKIELRMCDVHTVRDGRVEELRVYSDDGVMMAQLGLDG